MKPIDIHGRSAARLGSLDREPLLKIAVGTVIALFVLLAIRYQIKLLTYIEWGDEHETIVTAKMLASGSILYAEVFNHHGPLTFLSGYLLEKIGNFGIVGHRVPIAILQWIALVAIYFSPLMKDRIIRLVYTGLAASGMLLYLPTAYGHAYLYQVITGLLLVIILAQYTLPAICCPETLTTPKVAIGNLLIASLPFLAITYVPISLLLFASSVRGPFFRKQLAWFLAGIGLNILLLVYIGSIPGYLAYHLHMNLNVLALYAGGHSLKTLIEIVISNVVQPYQRSAILTVIAVSIAKLAFAERGFPWRSLLAGMGIASLLVRGGHFHALPYYYASLALPLIFFINLPQTKLRYKTFLMVGVMAIIFFMVKLSLILPSEREKLKSLQIREETEFSQLAQLFTSKGDKIIAYPFENLQYLAADRLPASGHFFYFPWQEKYNENPKFGIKIDACREINNYRPKIMLIDKRLVLNQFHWESYAGCIEKIVDQHYRRIPYGQIPERRYYVRKDLLAEDMGIALAQEPYKLLPGEQLGERSPIRIVMTASHKNEQAGIQRIGVMFKTQMTQNLGETELRLKRDGGGEFVKRFSLANLVDNKYHYFDIDAKHYTSGEIISITGGGVSTWESHSEKAGVTTCIIYEYSNEKRRFTPGCPIF